MSSGSKRDKPKQRGSKQERSKQRASGQRGDESQAARAARRKQMMVALVMGAVVGGVLAVLTQFWLWLPAGLAMGLATGAIMKPPAAS